MALTPYIGAGAFLVFRKRCFAMYNVLELKKSYGSTAILRDISLRIDDGEAVTIIGPSGSGKSTFLRCLNLLEDPTGGKIYFDNTLLDKDLDSKWLHQQVGMVFQKFNLFPMFTVLKNVMYAPMHVKHMPRKEAEELARDLLDRVGLQFFVVRRRDSDGAFSSALVKDRDRQRRAFRRVRSGTELVDKDQRSRLGEF